MKKIGIVSREGRIIPKIKKTVQDYGFRYTAKNPDLILTIGGDGTILFAERQYPEIPKLPIRYNSICKKCAAFDINHVLQNLKKDNYSIKKIPKLEVSYKNQKLHALNDIIMRNQHQWTALRFSLEVDGKLKGEFIGDGVVTATPFGSTGYFQSITGKNFAKGFALACNNLHSHTKQEPFFFKKKVQLNILREKAIVSVDNNPKILQVKEKETVSIYPQGKTSIIQLHP